ncbi:S8 family serine peptidase [Streptomyces sp. NPDC058409]|uniref:S8 family serine peptidase n=1 Tax=Streptomyces sp. NPDC058409 TaxID=3346484 RepID=UPI00365E1A98
MRRPVQQGSVALALIALLATGATTAAGAGADPEPGLKALSPAKAAAAAHTVRLITGDTVVVTGTGKQQIVSFKPDADSPTGIAEIQQSGTDIAVIPDEVRSLLAAGTLDARLFDIDALIAQGYADGADLPLIVRNAKASAPVPAGADSIRKLPSLDASAARVEAADTGTFWMGLRSAKKGATAKELAGGVEKVWLDGKVTASLDTSVPQIGAPEAWAKGYDGKGVKVAVLDTGVDATHPDLAGRVTEIRNFSETADAVDHHGHGTHVASTVGGTGAADGGKRKGVAPGAELMVGKVLNDQGSGTDSSVLGGMEWAARNGAKIISMSLGTQAADDGTGPLAVALNELTAETGALFVVAAGNTGPNATTIGSPGSADAALTVAAVDKQDKIASFSSRGPRLGDNALKPDIAAPGVDIVAARAAGTTMGTPVDGNYTSASGTSMATPHVAGAAAIVAQAHPDWSAADIKGALMSGAKVLGSGAFAEGSGRTDVPAAIAQRVWATNASFGTVAPKGSTAPVTRTVTFHNTGDQPVTLDLTGELKRDGGAVAPGALTLGADSVTVPAGGSGEVPVTLAPDLATEYGTYTGTVLATGDGVTMHATVALNRELPVVKVTVKGVMPDGTPAGSLSSISLRSQTTDLPPTRLTMNNDGVATAQVRPGRYSVIGHLRQGNDFVSFGMPDVVVGDEPVTVTADGRDGVPIKAKTPRPGELRNLILTVSRRSAEQTIGSSSTYVLGRAGGHQWAVPAAKPQGGTFGLTTNFVLQAPPIIAKALLPGGVTDLRAESYLGSGRWDGTRGLSAVDAGLGSEADLAGVSLQGKLALVRLGDESIYTLLPRLVEAGASAVMLVSRIDDRQVGAIDTTIPVFGVPKSQGDRVADALRKGKVTVRTSVETYPSYLYGLVSGTADGISADQTYAPVAKELAEIKVKTYSPSADPATLEYSQDGWLGYSETSERGSGAFADLTFGRTQRVYVTSENAKWQRVAVPVGDGPQTGSPLKEYKAGTSVTEEWLKPVMRSASPVSASGKGNALAPFRTEEGMLVQLPVWASASAETWESLSLKPYDTNTFRVFADGKLIGSAPVAFAEITGLPEAKSGYRFELDAHRATDWWNVSTEAHTAWTFESAAPEGTEEVKLALLNADYDLDGVRMDSTVKAGASHRLKVAFRNADKSTSPVTRATVEVSYDGGATWHRQHAVTTAHAATTWIKAPKGTDTVSLRVKAENAAGSGIEQTVIDAVRVTG